MIDLLRYDSHDYILLISYCIINTSFKRPNKDNVTLCIKLLLHFVLIKQISSKNQIMEIWKERWYLQYVSNTLVMWKLKTYIEGIVPFCWIIIHINHILLHLWKFKCHDKFCLYEYFLIYHLIKFSFALTFILILLIQVTYLNLKNEHFFVINYFKTYS